MCQMLYALEMTDNLEVTVVRGCLTKIRRSMMRYQQNLKKRHVYILEGDQMRGGGGGGLCMKIVVAAAVWSKKIEVKEKLMKR